MNPTAKAHEETAEDVAVRATRNLALLIRLAEAEARSPRQGDNPGLDEEAWYAIERMLLTTRRDVKRLEQLALARGAK